MKTILIQPAMHRIVRDPISQAMLPSDTPTEVPASSFWLRRLKMGDVVLVEQAKAQAPKKIRVKVAEPAAKEE